MMKYILVMLLAGCASVKTAKQPFVDIGIDGQPQIIHTLESASQVETPELIGAGDALGIDTFYRMEDEASKKDFPLWLYLDGALLY